MYEPFPAHPLIREIVTAQTGLPEDQALQPNIVRKFFSEQAATIPVADALREERIVQVDSLNIKLTFIRPHGSENKTLPIILFFHGGGFFMGDINTHSILVYQLAIQTPAVVVFVDYSLSPEAKHPIALEECYAALTWINKNAASFNGDPNRLALCGDSAGGNMTAAIAAYAKEKGNTSIKAQVLLYPMLGINFETESYTKYKNDSFLPREVMQWVWRQYLTEESKTSRFAVPQLSTKEQLEGLPPALIITAEKDVLRDDGEAYNNQLKKAGVNTVALRYFGVRHGFFTEPSLSPEALAGIQQIVYFLKKTWSNELANL
ncbi:Alpha/Beta hydrolase protein [Cunninghamella echinulata]|nr:Alpha/Beta hydrolase protein [Cunninghamella echinulata]